jgi:hypothetical protein
MACATPSSASAHPDPVNTIAAARDDDPVCRCLPAGYARRAIIAVVGARLDTKLNLHLFSRLLRLPLDYFERHPVGETMYQVAQVYRVREFLTGQLLATFLDLLTLAVLLPFLFWLNAPLAWVVVLCAALISAIILAYLKPMHDMYGQVVGAETWKAEGGGAQRDDHRGEDGQGASIGAAASRPVGRAGGGDRQVAARLCPIVELAADPGDADRALYDDGHADVGRLLGDGRQFGLHGR